MKNKEKDYQDQIKTSSNSVEKTNQEYNKNAVTLPIIDQSKKTVSNKNSEKNDGLKVAKGNNYTAAENGIRIIVRSDN